MDYKNALELLENGKAKDCISFFKSSGYDLEYAYSLFFMKDIDEACKQLQNLDSVRADWLKKIITIIKGRIEYPTYFQIRNFLEIDLTLLIKYREADYVNAILKCADTFQGINNETYKFLGRVLLKNGFLNESKIFLEKSLNSYYNDVELHYLFVEYYLYLKDYAEARHQVLSCLRINPEYYPAKRTYQLLNNAV